MARPRLRQQVSRDLRAVTARARYNSPMSRKRSAQPSAEQLVFPFQLQVGDVVREDGARLEVVGRPTAMTGGKMTRAWLRAEGETVQREAVWEAWRKLRIVRSSAA